MSSDFSLQTTGAGTGWQGTTCDTRRTRSTRAERTQIHGMLASGTTNNRVDAAVIHDLSYQPLATGGAWLLRTRGAVIRRAQGQGGGSMQRRTER